MTVGELITLLRQFDKDLPIVPIQYYGEGTREELSEPELNEYGEVEI